jgi:hypothetical protein
MEKEVKGSKSPLRDTGWELIVFVLDDDLPEHLWLLVICDVDAEDPQDLEWLGCFSYELEREEALFFVDDLS